MTREELNLWSNINNPNNNANMNDWADAHNPNNDSYLANYDDDAVDIYGVFDEDDD